MARHYIAMSGGRGEKPAYCQVCSTKESAVRTLAAHLKISPRVNQGYAVKMIRAELREMGFVWKSGGPVLDVDYADITACDCNDPAQHCRDGE